MINNSNYSSLPPQINPDTLSESQILEEEIDENYEPDEQEILNYAEHLGMDLQQDQQFFYIAKEGLKAPLPYPWKPCSTRDQEIYYLNFETHQTTLEHPCDQYYRDMFLKEKQKFIEKQVQKQQKRKNPLQQAMAAGQDLYGGQEIQKEVLPTVLPKHDIFKKQNDPLLKQENDKKLKQYREQALEELEKKKQQFEEQFQQNIEQIDKDFQRKVNKMNEEFQGKKEQEEIKFKQMIEDLEAGIGQESVDLKKDLEKYEMEMKLELEKMNKNKLETERNELENDLENQKIRINKKYEDKLNRKKQELKAESERKIQNLEREEKKLRQKLNQKSEPFNPQEELQRIKQEYIKDAEIKFLQEKKELKKQLEDNLEQFKEQESRKFELEIKKIQNEIEDQENGPNKEFEENEYRRQLEKENEEKMREFDAQLEKEKELEELKIQEELAQFESKQKEEIQKKIDLEIQQMENIFKQEQNRKNNEINLEKAKIEQNSLNEFMEYKEYFNKIMAQEEKVIAYILYLSSNACYTCTSPCSQCTGTDTTCTACDNGYYLLGNSCPSTCGTGYYDNSSTNTCDTCTSPCSDCSTSITTCTACENGYYLDGNTCDTTCPTTYFGNTSTNTCDPCDGSCQQCTGPSNAECSQCVGGYYLYTTTCDTTCPNGYYPFSTTNTCELCSSECATCSSATVCLSCVDGYFFDSATSTCVTTGNCPVGTYELGPPSNLCDNCDTGCTECTSTSSNCQSCDTGYFWQNGDTCATTCPAGQWAYATNSICCDDSCLTCENTATNCTSCPDGLYYNSGSNSCLNNCPDGQSPVGPPHNTCSDCYNTCQTCNGLSNTDCLSCTGAYYYYDEDSTCVTTCVDGYWEDASDTSAQVCGDCDANCLTCGNSAVQCTSCYQKYLDPTTETCVATCPNGYGGVGDPTWECQTCHISCATCYGINYGQCNDCAVGYVRDDPNYDRCIECGDGFYGDTVTDSCVPCDTSCATCYGPSNTECNSCNNGYYLNPDLSNPNTCQANCEGANACGLSTATIICESSINECVACHSTCQTCTGSNLNQCSSCVPGYYLYFTQCVLTCPTNYYADDPLQKCIECASPCQTCDNDDNECYSCTETTYLLNNQCLSTCPNGYYTDDVNNLCVACEAQCETCGWVSGVVECLTCYANTYLYQGDCLTDCPDGMYGEDSTLTCEDCFSGCTLCETTYDNCSECVTGYYLYGNTCDITCPTSGLIYAVGYPTNACVVYSCDDVNCEFCFATSTNMCRSCNVGYYLQGFVCVTECGNGYYEDTATNACQLCDPSCVTCDTSPTYCDECVSPTYYLYTPEMECITNCDSYQGWYTGTTQCEQCNVACKICTAGTANDCSSCNPNYYLFGTSCLSVCPVEYFANTNSLTCEECVEPCKECTNYNNNGEFCTSCIDNYYLYNNDCIVSCPLGWIGNDATNECVECDVSCMECDGIAYNQCTACSTGSSVGPFLLNGQCLYPCPSGYYAKIQTSTCEQCNIRCATCFNDGYEKCYTCSAGYFLKTNSCLEDCGEGYYSDASDVCHACDSTCKNCTGNTRYDCTECNLDRIFEGGNFCKACEEYYGYEDDPKIQEDEQMVCREICGDGVTVSDTYECDDGNNLNGDGCSSDCQVEEGYWICEGGDMYTPSTCYDYRDIGFFIEYESEYYYNYDENHSLNFTLYFNKTFVLPDGKYIEDYLTFGFEGLDDRFEFEIASTTYRNGRRNLLIQPAEIINGADITDGFGQSLAYSSITSDNQVMKYIFYSDQQRNQADLIQSILFPFYFTNFFIPNVLKTVYENYNDYETPFENFNIQQLDTLYLNNCGSFMLIFFILLFIYLVFNFISMKTQHEFKFTAFFQRIFNGYLKFAFPIDFMLISSGVFVGFGAMQLTQFSKALDFVLGIFMTGTNLVALFFLILKQYRNRNNLFMPLDNDGVEGEWEEVSNKIKRNNNTFSIRNMYIFTNFDDNWQKGFYFHLLCIRKIWLGISVLIFQSIPYFNLSFQVIFHIVILVLLYKYQIFRDPKAHLRVFVNEVLLLIGMCMIFGIIYDWKENEYFKTNYQWAIIIIFSIILVGNCIYLILQNVVFPFIYGDQNVFGQRAQVYNVNGGIVKPSNNFAFGQAQNKKQKAQPFQADLYLSRREIDELQIQEKYNNQNKKKKQRYINQKVEKVTYNNINESPQQSDTQTMVSLDRDITTNHSQRIPLQDPNSSQINSNANFKLLLGLIELTQSILQLKLKLNPNK
ncbi:WW domain [Pseudocohnilembus persalinus]|uniref:WW domain n=1 Tax=Pseudocohnilembus persalinus TaxID=266149 RepID=A0A0V0QR87_PSEPJ|nr:WW domain [Pseudocohnilembus persalinus]|eukprot:KRX04787.1 WW domain [Pseudocohnilembus persalinus]